MSVEDCDGPERVWLSDLNRQRVLLGVVAWPKPGEPQWKAFVLIFGMLASVAGMALRFVSHRKEKAAIVYAQQEAQRAKGA